MTVSNQIFPTTLGPTLDSTSLGGTATSSQAGMLIINADDWGRESETTNRILECTLLGSVSSASAMVFMEDSQRAADLALERGIDAGLHLNFTTPFSAPIARQALVDHHARVSRFLLGNPLCKVIYHPGLSNSFEYLVSAQLEEYQRIFHAAPSRVDGHHHMHLCANVLFGGLLPAGTIARRNFSFHPGEKSGMNRAYRRFTDGILAKRHRLTDYFFSLPPLEPVARLERIFGTAGHSVVEVETHPINPEEHLFLTGSGVRRFTNNLPIARRFTLRASASQIQ